MIDKEILRIVFQDFDLLNYDYNFKVRFYIQLTNKNGSINQIIPSFDNYIDLYKNHRSRKPIVTYKDDLMIDFHFFRL
jgi:hypothetical protein